MKTGQFIFRELEVLQETQMCCLVRADGGRGFVNCYMKLS